MCSIEVWSEGHFSQPWKEKILHRDQTISEMVEEVLANQAKSLAERTGQTFEGALGVVADTEAGRQLRELASGEHRHEKARACYELGRKSHRNADSTVGLGPSRSTFPAFLSRF